MSLKLKRNLPIVLFLILFLSLLAFALGSQRIIAYTLEAGSELPQQAASLGLVRIDEIDPLVSLLTMPSTKDVSRLNFMEDMPYVISESIMNV